MGGRYINFSAGDGKVKLFVRHCYSAGSGKAEAFVAKTSLINNIEVFNKAFKNN